MAVHVPKGLTYQERYDSWMAGICPYCHTSKFVTRFFVNDGKGFQCVYPGCGAMNRFTLKRLIDGEKKA